MLEKKPGNMNVDKLQAILLLEADFNVVNKIISNTRVIPQLELLKSIPAKVIEGQYR